MARGGGGEKRMRLGFGLGGRVPVSDMLALAVFGTPQAVLDQAASALTAGARDGAR
ncbi:MAG: hypothetical protein AB1609_12965 [Bacillota bacterium]